MIYGKYHSQDWSLEDLEREAEKKNNELALALIERFKEREELRWEEAYEEGWREGNDYGFRFREEE